MVRLSGDKRPEDQKKRNSEKLNDLKPFQNISVHWRTLRPLETVFLISFGALRPQDSGLSAVSKRTPNHRSIANIESSDSEKQIHVLGINLLWRALRHAKSGEYVANIR